MGRYHSGHIHTVSRNSPRDQSSCHRETHTVCSLLTSHSAAVEERTLCLSILHRLTRRLEILSFNYCMQINKNVNESVSSHSIAGQRNFLQIIVVNNDIGKSCIFF